MGVGEGKEAKRGLSPFPLAFRDPLRLAYSGISSSLTNISALPRALPSFGGRLLQKWQH